MHQKQPPAKIAVFVASAARLCQLCAGSNMVAANRIAATAPTDLAFIEHLRRIIVRPKIGLHETCEYRLSRDREPI
jgi:hypothetical protein